MSCLFFSGVYISLNVLFAWMFSYVRVEHRFKIRTLLVLLFQTRKREKKWKCGTSLWFVCVYNNSVASACISVAVCHTQAVVGGFWNSCCCCRDFDCLLLLLLLQSLCIRLCPLLQVYLDSFLFFSCESFALLAMTWTANSQANFTVILIYMQRIWISCITRDSDWFWRTGSRFECVFPSRILEYCIFTDCVRSPPRICHPTSSYT